MINGLNSELNAKRHELIRLADKETNPEKKLLYDKEIGHMELQINKNIIDSLQNVKNNKPIVQETKKEFTDKELRIIVKKRFEEYKQAAIKVRELYPKLVEKKREAGALYKSISNSKKKGEILEQVLRY